METTAQSGMWILATADSWSISADELRSMSGGAWQELLDCEAMRRDEYAPTIVVDLEAESASGAGETRVDRRR